MAAMSSSAAAGGAAPGAALNTDVPLADKPTVILTIGMAGSGKTTFMRVRRPPPPPFLFGGWMN